jgi:hypothetical protein
MGVLEVLEVLGYCNRWRRFRHEVSLGFRFSFFAAATRSKLLDWLEIVKFYIAHA